ncbi:M1 family peptidase [Flavobacteriaceae bacterium Ap0902]|nr:M1 family peptidase [Flavobacteriaceae bacterium Ap0902]
MKFNIIFSLLFAFSFVNAQNIQNNPDSNHGNKFEQLGTILPTPNVYRTGSGAPGHAYWQQKADYKIKARLDEDNQAITASETITYHNNSPDDLEYLWMQLDENKNSSIDNPGFAHSSTIPEATTESSVAVTEIPAKDNGYGVKISKVTDVHNQPLNYVINKTMMRVDLEKPLKAGEQITFHVDWRYKMVNRMTMGGRGGYEYFEEDGNHLFTMTQWFPRMCVYSDAKGWQNNQFSGRAEFALVFGDYEVEMDVPADHLVAATGEAQNYEEVLTKTQLERYRQSQKSDKPIEIVTLAEAKANEKNKSKERKVWKFKADNVRDFAWTSSRKYVWDAMSQTVPQSNEEVMCMSFYPKESYHLYSKFSTRAVAHTIKTYSDFTIPYPYPVAQSVEAANGMEYPMICFNYGRTEPDGTYSEAIKNGMIGVIIHEVGHNFFPMIINSDERQWTWMDEGLNTFLQYLTEQLWDNKFPSRRGPAYTIVDYMKLPKDQLEPIMVNSENIIHFGPNAYAKPATGLNMLRETIMGRELFDKAFKTYARRWAFRHPEPADFFRTMEDASGEDLDWFWRGWFYDTDPVDIAIKDVKVAKPNLDAEPTAREIEYKVTEPLESDFDDITKIRNREDANIKFYTDEYPETRDFYWRYTRGMEKVDTVKIHTLKMDNLEKLSTVDKERLKNVTAYQIDFENIGGMVMPIILEFTFEDGSKLYDKTNAQIWRKNENACSLTYYFDKKLKSIQLDPMKETSDIDTSNNYWGEIAEAQSRFDVFKNKSKNARGASGGKVNPMQAAQ